MAIANKGDLESLVADWAHINSNSGVISKIPDFITLTEAQLVRDNYLREYETEANLTATPSSQYIDLPGTAKNFIRPQTLWLTFYLPREELPYIGPEKMPLWTSEGVPTYWSVDSNHRLVFDTKADKAYTYLLRYVARDDLSGDGDTNWILDMAPDVYLYGTLVHLADYIRDDAKKDEWSAYFNTAYAILKNQQHRAKALEQLHTELPFKKRRSNIYEGY